MLNVEKVRENTVGVRKLKVEKVWESIRTFVNVRKSSRKLLNVEGL